MLHMTYNFTPEKTPKFECKKCHFICSKQSDFNRHITTRKHKKTYEDLHNTDNLNEKNANCNVKCKCGKQYHHRQSLYKHKKICTTINNEQQAPDSNVVIELIKQNQEFKELLVDQNKTIIDQNNKIIEACKNNNTNITNNVNSHNKAFNLNVFLNEDCKDAMNVTQFIDSFNLQLSDFENVGNVGFVNGISDIIIKKLKSLDISERPIHCTDQKRQVLYAKVIDKWEKEGDDNKILRKIIKCVAFKNSKNIQLFRDKYPDCMNWDSKHADRYQILRIESLGGLGNEDVDNENKIIRKIAREITLDKNF